MNEALIWLGILFCVSQSASLSGLNLAVFRMSRLRLELAAEQGDANARRVLGLRRDANFTLVSILWANVGVNVLLTLLAESILTGVAAFFFSTVIITFVGEIIPQAYFSSHALRVASLLTPLLRFYQWILWPIAKPIGILLDLWVGPEGIPWFQEKELRDLLMKHSREFTEVGKIEAAGAINFLQLDDLTVRQEGQPLDPLSILRLPFHKDTPDFPDFERRVEDPFVKQVAASGKKWVVLTDPSGEPRLILNAHRFLRNALFGGKIFDPFAPCHRPLIVRDPHRPFGKILGRLTASPGRPDDDIIDEDLILLWADHERRIITGSDILGRLLRRIAQPASGWREPDRTPPD